MIQMANEGSVATFRNQFRERLVNSFIGEERQALDVFKDVVSKAVEVEEFEKAYPTDKFQRFTAANLMKFKDDLTKAEGGESFSKLIEGLKPVAVKKDEQSIVLFVREIPAA